MNRVTELNCAGLDLADPDVGDFTAYHLHLSAPVCPIIGPLLKSAIEEAPPEVLDEIKGRFLQQIMSSYRPDLVPDRAVICANWLFREVLSGVLVAVDAVRLAFEVRNALPPFGSELIWSARQLASGIALEMNKAINAAFDLKLKEMPHGYFAAREVATQVRLALESVGLRQQPDWVLVTVGATVAGLRAADAWHYLPGLFEQLTSVG
jgi:hypothetical protein